MWPFKKKSPAKSKVVYGPEVLTMIEMKQKYPVGSSFIYLGRNFSVTEHREFDCAPHHHPFLIPRNPTLVADYVDNSGVIHTGRFSGAQLRHMLDELRMINEAAR